MNAPPAELARGRRIPGTVAVFWAVIVIGTIASIISVSSGASTAYRDEQLHLTIARRITDSTGPGFQQLGTVWLPAPHLLLLPFVQNFWLWNTGIAAAILSTLCLGASGAALYRIGARLGFGRNARLIGVLVFVSSPGILYVFTTALTEPVLIAGMLCCFAGLARWMTSPRSLSAGELAVFAGIPLAVATMSRYEGWALIAGGTLFVAIVQLRKRQGFKRVVIMTSAFAALPIAAIAWWLSYNWALYGNPLEFINGQFSAAALQATITTGGLVTTKGNLGMSSWVYFWVLVQSFGAITLALAGVGAVILAAREGLSNRALLIWLTAVAMVFSLVSLATGQTVIYSDHTLPPGWWNTRYALSSAPFLALLIAYLCHTATEWMPALRHRGRPIALALALSLALQTCFMLAEPFTRVAVIAEVHDQQSSFSDMRGTLTWLGANYDGGKILIDESNNPFVLDLKLPLVDLVDYSAGADFIDARKSPASHARWIFLHEGEPADVVAASMAEDPARLSSYSLVYSDGPYRVYRLVD
ncbi:hypothetical protein GCM10011399_03730 [Subtercola lobariae]|uniref:Glycosyltransferase RgtA/B/C/D-like domain-containing protein n=2 Tax=Subtercola lobariae TaxID=1588641 RepID=A0A917AZV3_9MICO|nr:hypothetical protein GCM10011399_03730 [Subtercola lobariae]